MEMNATASLHRPEPIRRSRVRYPGLLYSNRCNLLRRRLFELEVAWFQLYFNVVTPFTRDKRNPDLISRLKVESYIIHERPASTLQTSFYPLSSRTLASSPAVFTHTLSLPVFSILYQFEAFYHRGAIYWTVGKTRRPSTRGIATTWEKVDEWKYSKSRIGEFSFLLFLRINDTLVSDYICKDITESTRRRKIRSEHLVVNFIARESKRKEIDSSLKIYSALTNPSSRKSWTEI